MDEEECCELELKHNITDRSFNDSVSSELCKNSFDSLNVSCTQECDEVDIVGSVEEDSEEGSCIKQEKDEAQADHEEVGYLVADNVFVPTVFRLECDDDKFMPHDAVSDTHVTSGESNVVKQTRMHAAKKLAKCKVCGESFKGNRELAKHSKTMHKSEKTHKCTVCGKSFTRNANLVWHMRRHADTESKGHGTETQRMKRASVHPATLQESEKRQRILESEKQYHQQTICLGEVFGRWEALRTRLNIPAQKDFARLLVEHYESTEQQMSGSDNSPSETVLEEPEETLSVVTELATVEAGHGRTTLDQFLEEVAMNSDSDNDYDVAPESDCDSDGESNNNTDTNDDSSDSDPSAVLDEVPITRALLDSAYDDTWLTPFTHNTGPLKHNENSSELDVFCDFFTNEVFNIMTSETNRYASQFIQKAGGMDGLKAHSRIKRWVDVDVSEMRAFVAILILMGIDCRANYELYWTTDGFLEMTGFRSIMSRDRFLLILQFFHFVDNSNTLSRGHPQHDRIFKVRSLINILVPAWQAAFHPGREVYVDQSIIPSKDRSVVAQCCPNKCGLSAWVLADARTGYTWNWNLNVGKQGGESSKHGVMYRVVTDICRPLYGLGHHVYMDNRFTSPVLFDELARQNCGACGTLNVNCKKVPGAVKEAQGMVKKGDPATVVRSGKKMYVVWKGERTVNVVSTVHDTSTFTKRVRARSEADSHNKIIKPCAIELFTKYMGGVDIGEHHVWSFVSLHQSMKWWKKVYVALQEVSLVNAFIIFRNASGNNITPYRFRLNVVRGLLADYSRNRIVLRPIGDVPNRLTQHHFIEINPTRTSSGRQSFPDCAVCSNRKVKRHQTEYQCEQCRIPMCPHPCFRLFHTKLNYKTDCVKELHRT